MHHSQMKAAPKAKRGGKPAVPKSAPASRKETATKQTRLPGKRRRMKHGTDRKKSAVIGPLRRKEGATVAEIAKITNWQPHTIRGSISGRSRRR